MDKVPKMDEYFDLSLYGSAETGEDPDDGNDYYFTRERYWYHPNYLEDRGKEIYPLNKFPEEPACRVGDMITNDNGQIHQYFVYSPFGENLYQYNRNSEFNSRYRFNGKELDPETGNQYYGARYYDPKISVWLSVDPLAHRFPSVTSYNFVLNNPIHFTDPTGMSPESKEGGFWEKIGNVLTGNGFHTNEEVKQIENSSELDEVVITDTNTEGEICSGCSKESDHEQGGKGQWGDKQEQLIKWPKNKDDSGDIMDPFSPPGAPAAARLYRVVLSAIRLLLKK